MNPAADEASTVRLAIVNARVWTADPRRPWADALLVEGSVLAGVGSSAEIRKRAGRDTVAVDGRGLTVLPADLLAALREAAPRAAANGILRAGMPASLVMLDRALGRIDAAALGDASVLLAITDGRVTQDPGGLLSGG